RRRRRDRRASPAACLPPHTPGTGQPQGYKPLSTNAVDRFCLSGSVFWIVTVTVWLEVHDPLTSNGGVTVLSLLGEEMLIIGVLHQGCQRQRLATAWKPVRTARSRLVAQAESRSSAWSLSILRVAEVVKLKKSELLLVQRPENSRWTRR